MNEMATKNPELIPFAVTQRPANQVPNTFSKFNNGAHLLVEIPDGHSTISCRTSTGERFTVAFLPYEENGPPACVDVTTYRPETNSSGTPVNDVICFTQGSAKEYRSGSLPSDEKPTIITLMFQHGVDYHNAAK